MNSKILDQLEEIYAEEWNLARGDLRQSEEVVQAVMKSLGRGLLQRLVDRGRNGYEGSAVPCSCGQMMRFVGHRPRQMHTLLGWVTIRRAYYHCPSCHQNRVPYDQASGLGSEQLSPALGQACCLLAVDDSFAETARKITVLFGEEVSDTTVERLVHHVGAVSIQQQQDQYERFADQRQLPAPHAHPQRLYVGVDGTTAHERDGWHEVKIGCIYWEDEHLQRRRYYVGRFCNSETFGWYLWLAACQWGLRGAVEVVYLGDGAPWIRTEHDRHFRRATFIIDWYHASEHVWECGKRLFGEGTALTDQWVRQRLSLLWEGQTRALLEDLTEQRRGHRDGKREALDALLRYVRTNEQQMRYDVFRERGYAIGSGAVEGACKHVVGKRLKQSGMIWTRPGAAAVLALRITWLNAEWNSFWDSKPMAA